MTPQAKKNLEREIRKRRHQILTDFNTEHKGVPGEIRDVLKAELNRNLDMWAAFMRSQSNQEPSNPNKQLKTFYLDFE